MVSSFIQYTPTRYGKYTYPLWAEVLGWGIALASVVWVPVGAIHEILGHKGSFLQVRARLFLFCPDGQEHDCHLLRLYFFSCKVQSLNPMANSTSNILCSSGSHPDCAFLYVACQSFIVFF